MQPQQIKDILKEQLNLTEIYVTGENSHYNIIAVSDDFLHLSKLKQQQMIYNPLMEYITNNQIHALTIKTFTIEKWARERVFNPHF